MNLRVHNNKNDKIGLTAYYRSPARNKLNYKNDLEIYLSEIDEQSIEIYTSIYLILKVMIQTHT